MNIVLRNESQIVSIPKRLQDVIKEIWRLQYDFANKKEEYEDVLKSFRLQAGYDFLSIRAQVDSSQVNKAIWWKPYTEKDVEEQR